MRPETQFAILIMILALMLPLSLFLVRLVRIILVHRNPRVTYNNPWEVSGGRLSLQYKQQTLRD